MRPSMPTLSFSSWRDRLTWALVEARWLWFFACILLGITLGVTQPEVGPLPEWAVDVAAAFAILGPPLFVAGIKFASWLRERRHITVYHVNAVEEQMEKYLVPPEVWAEKTVEGPDPYPICGGSAWAVHDLDWHEDVEELVVSGVWLSELEDVKLLTKRSHMEEMYATLVDSHIKLGIMRDSVSRLGADIQNDLINSVAEADERARMMDKTATKDAFEDAEERAGSIGEQDLPSLDADEIEPWQVSEPAESVGGEEAVATSGEQDVAADGGGESSP
jgi:hypothetical protein